MSFSLSDSQAFKSNALALIDKIRVLGEQCLQLGKIGFVIMDQKISLESILNTAGSFVSILQKVIEVKQKLTKFTEIISSSNSMARSLEEILTIYQELNEEQRKITSKVSMNKQIFLRCKTDLVQLTRFFNGYQQIVPILQKIALS